MNIKEAKQEIIHTLQAYNRKDEAGNYVYPVVRQRPILLIGPPGVGKTAIMEQIATECQVGLVAYTITHHTRQSAVGLPKIRTQIYNGVEMDVTEYTMSEMIASIYRYMEQTGKKEGLLFIDEINCVSETLAPTMLQLLQNKTFGTHRVPEGWMIVAAGNPPEFNKSVREFDIATLDRVRRITVESDCDVWLEYGWERKLHGAILSYLDVKKDQFYIAQNTSEGKAFVTARGWEDLSELLKSYEWLQAEIREELVFEFLQKREVAREFTAYYHLYMKFYMDYGIPEILEGAVGEALYRQRVEMAAGSGFEERFMVTGLLLEAIVREAAEYRNLDEQTGILLERLKMVKGRLEGSGDAGVFRNFLSEQRKGLEAAVRQELFSAQERKAMEKQLEILEGMELEIRKRHIQEIPEMIRCMRELFEPFLKQRKEAQSHMKKSLEHAFDFLEDCFGDGQEMVLFVTRLTDSREVCSFLRQNGCKKFLEHSDVLLYREKEEKLMEACRKMLDEVPES